MLGARLQDRQLANQIERLILEDAQPAFVGHAVFGLGEFFQRHRPGPVRSSRIGRSQIRACDMQVELWLANGLVAGRHQDEGFSTVLGAKALLFACLRVLDVEDTAALAAIEDEPTFHRLQLFAEV